MLRGWIGGQFRKCPSMLRGAAALPYAALAVRSYFFCYYMLRGYYILRRIRGLRCRDRRCKCSLVCVSDVYILRAHRIYAAQYMWVRRLYVAPAICGAVSINR